MLLACSGELLGTVFVGVVIGASTFHGLVMGSRFPLRIIALLCWMVMSSLVNTASHPLSQNLPIDNEFLSTFLK